MSTRAIRDAAEHLQALADVGGPNADALGIMARAAMREVEAIEKAAADLSRLSVGDFTYNIRDRAAGDASFTGNTWEHPDVKAWSDASVLMEQVAKSAPKT